MLLHQKFKNHRIILASQSPRRKELLSGLDLDFEVIPLHIDETYPDSLKRQEITDYLSVQKAAAFDSFDTNTLLITSDTIVWLNGKALEKPLNEAHAVEMLKQLSGNTHEVITSVGVFTTHKKLIFNDVTEVTFGELSDEEIAYYIQKYQPYDKAGSYGVQEWIGYMGVKEMKGSYFNVMGLPVYQLYQVLKDF